MTIKTISYKDGYKYQLHGNPRSVLWSVYHDCYIYSLPKAPTTGISSGSTLLKFCGIEVINQDNIRLKIMPGYAWDGASGPAIDTKDSMIATLIHDVGYQLIRQGILSGKIWKDYFDQLFYEIFLEDSIETVNKRKFAITRFTGRVRAKVRAKIWLIAVKNFGWTALKSPREIKHAP